MNSRRQLGKGAQLWVGVLLLCSLSQAEAGDKRVRLEYTLGAGAEACPDRSRLGEIVASELGYAPFEEGAGERLSVRIGRDAQGLTATLELVDAEDKVVGQRELSSSATDCRELSSALALAIALAIDPSYVRGKPRRPVAPEKPAPKPEPQPEPVKASAPAPVERVEPQSAPPPKPTVPTRVELAGGLSASVGSVVAPSAGLWVYGGALRERWSLGLEGRADLPRQKSTQSGSVRAGLLLASLVPCARLEPLRLCALLSAGALQGRGEGVSAPKSGTTFHSAAGVRARTQVALGGDLALVAQVDGRAALTRTTLQIDGEDVWTTPAFAGALGLGLAGQL